MPNYRILGSMTQYYEFNIEANSEQEAIDEVRRIENTQSVDDYIDGWEPLEITDIEEEEAK